MKLLLKTTYTYKNKKWTDDSEIELGTNVIKKR